MTREPSPVSPPVVLTIAGSDSGGGAGIRAVHRFEHPRVEAAATHGSGCMLSAAIATRLARGDPLPAAVEFGTDLLARAVAAHLDVGQGPGRSTTRSTGARRADTDRCNDLPLS